MDPILGIDPVWFIAAPAFIIHSVYKARAERAAAIKRHPVSRTK